MSKENVDEGSPGANATKEKAFVGLWNPGSRGHENQTAARLSAAHHDDVLGALRGVPAEVGRGKTLVFAASALGRRLSPLNIFLFNGARSDLYRGSRASYNFKIHSDCMPE
ncbi:MAG TPA: hypothetical protein VLJ11_04950 [Bryobacteraceae bacterium]|nr:hypothetical protein [Bryobacteraceae bacterium]